MSTENTATLIKVGDMVKKVHGLNAGMSGLIVSIETNIAGNTLVEVLTPSSEMWVWPIQYVKGIIK